jgi:two-component system, OmpR family, sensor histidine kinase KdpD
MARFREYAYALLVVLAASVVCLVLRPHLATIDVAMLLLLAVVLVAARYRRGPALVASALSIAVFDFVFVPPYYTFDVHDTAYFLTFVVMLVVAVIMSGLTARIREEADASQEREQRTAALYALDRELASAGNPEELLAIATRHLGQAAGGTAHILLVDRDVPVPELPRWPPTVTFESPSVRVAAAWAFEHGEAAGWGMPRCAEAEALAAPLRTGSGMLGVVVIDPGDSNRDLAEADRDTILALTALTAASLERAVLAERSEKSRKEVEGEKLRTALLSSLSHDLRTPLGSIEGAASSLLQADGALPDDVRRELVEAILDESRRMTSLVTNLLDMIRVETGALVVHKEWQPLEEALGVALLRLDQRLKGHPVTTRLPSDLPLVPIDGLLIEQVFINLLENAARYTPPGTPVSIRAWPEGGAVVVEVADRGPGIPAGQEEAIFGRFYRAPTSETEGGAGSGLGLTICRGIIAAHGGRIWGDSPPAGGAAFRFILPLEGPPMQPLPADPAGMRGAA